MRASGPQEFLEYDKLPLRGYLDDGKLTGFKTPVFQNGRMPATQFVAEDNFVSGYRPCSDEDVERIVRPNFPFTSESRIGEPPVFLYRSEIEAVVGRKSEIVGKIMTVLRSAEKLSALEKLDLLTFCDAPKASVIEAIHAASWELHESGVPNADEWARRATKRYENKNLPVDTDNFIGSPEFLGIPEIEDRAVSAVSELPETFVKQKAKKFLVEYQRCKILFKLPGYHQKAEACRRLYSLSAEVDGLSIDALSMLTNASYFILIWILLESRNAEQTPINSIADLPPADLILDFCNSPAASRIRMLPELIANSEIIEPSKVYPPHLLLSGSVSGDKENNDVSVNTSNDIKFHVPSELLSIRLFNNFDRARNFELFSTTLNNSASMRGAEHVKSVLELFFPTNTEIDSPLDLYMGASNSWAVVVVSGGKKWQLLRGQGVYIDQITEVAGIRRITVLERKDGFEEKIKEFIDQSWFDLSIVELSEGHVIVEVPIRDGMQDIDLRKFRTFNSMWAKLFPYTTLNARARSFVNGNVSLLELDSSPVDDWEYEGVA